MVYVDNAAVPFKGRPRYHLAADSVVELHVFCARLGIAPCWFHRGARHPHYDITREQRESAINAGARPVDSKTLIRHVRMGQAKLPEAHREK